MTLIDPPLPGEVTQLTPELQCILAPNPSPMTGPGTNTYIFGDRIVAVIDPGPNDASHFGAIQAALSDRVVSHIFVTHSHLDHSPLARPLADATGAPIVAFGDTFAGRSDVMTQLANAGMTGGGEGLDHSFRPDMLVTDEEIVEVDGKELTVLHTPGHLGNHISLRWGDAIFVGDTVMAWSTSLVSPPDGDMADFLRSCERLRAQDARIFYSGHGAPITAPNARLDELIAHRIARTAAILTALRAGPASVMDLVKTIYTDIDQALYVAAGRNVFAHLVALVTAGQVSAQPMLSPEAVFALQQP
ncbi:MAG: MBL fold metallo-hydrolase [Pseudomonadota bacterium]